MNRRLVNPFSSATVAIVPCLVALLFGGCTMSMHQPDPGRSTTAGPAGMAKPPLHQGRRRAVTRPGSSGGH